MNRQRLILFILVLLFIGVVLWSYSAMPRPKTVSTLTFKSGQREKPVTPAMAADKPVRVSDDGTILKLNLLEKELPGFKGYRRNIFKPDLVDEPKIIKPKIVAIKPPPPPPPPAAPEIKKPEAPPLAHFTFLGFLKRGSTKTIFLAKEKEILLVKKGDKIAGRYEATDISDQALTLTVADTGGKIIIPLVENQPLTAVK